MITWGSFVLGSVLVLAGCSVGERATPPAAGDPSAPTGCAGHVETGSLPDWADEGFHGDTRMPHVFGARGEIVAVLFGHPLAQVRPDASSNKILWVARPATTSPDPGESTTLKITATLDGTDTRVAHEVAGGPGPSIIDLPEAGCWHLDLRWAGRTDTMDLVYAERKP
ncbi:hypothetical protein [Micromonospora sp. CA-246542]|uniref:hypothetical protein n=1 Tax=Micromonospora sp. CA-246542 TaxID=3239959 RepID=UPI003D8A250F